LGNYAVVFFIAFLFAFLVTPLVEKTAFRIGAVDMPTARKVHARPMPRLGGVAIYFSLLIAFGFALLRFQKFTPEIWGILLGGSAILVVGVIDDLRNLSPGVKFLGQVLASSILVAFGMRIEFIGNPVGKQLLVLGPLSIPVTLFWMLTLINTINFIDGLDGLAAGVSSIAAVTLFLSALQTGQVTVAFLAIAVAGSAVGFLIHNFNPASIIMGDSGSMFLGFMLGAITLQGVMKSVVVLSLLVPLMILGVPIFDGAFAILRRIRHDRPLSRPDRGHIHHQLLDRGFTHRQTVIIIYVWCILLSAGAALSFATTRQKVMLKLIIISGLALLSFYLARRLGVFDQWRERVAGYSPWAKRVKSEEPEVRSRESGAGSQESGGKDRAGESREPAGKSQRQEVKSQGSRVMGQCEDAIHKTQDT
jgi:UDP-GlcNAc:undecaprenyl-phosphate GlcNAc-1-phosphate transferase